MILDYECKRCLITDACENKYAFQWDAYRPLVDRIPACTAQGGICPRGGGAARGGGCLPKGSLSGGGLPRPRPVNRMTDRQV